MTSSPRLRWKLWHLVAVVAVSALIFGLARAMGESAEVGGLVEGMVGFAILIGPFLLVLDRAVKMGDRTSGSIEGWGGRGGGARRFAARGLAAMVRLIFAMGGIGLVIVAWLSLICLLAWYLAD